MRQVWNVNGPTIVQYPGVNTIANGTYSIAETHTSRLKKTTGRRDGAAMNRPSASPQLGAMANNSLAMQSKTSSTQMNHPGPADQEPSDNHSRTKPPMSLYPRICR